MSSRFKFNWRPLEGTSVDSEAVQGVATTIPVILLYAMIAIIPISFAAYASLYTIPALSPVWEFVGLQNYYEAFSLPQFWGSLWRGIVFMVGSTLVQLVVGVWIALVLNQIDIFKRLITAVAFTAYLIPTVIVALLALHMLNQYMGVLHMVGAEWFGLWGERTFALGTSWAMPLLILTSSWKFSIFITIFTLAQLSSIPDRFYDAAKIVGANRWEMFRDITFPRIKGVILVAVLLRSVFMFNKFDYIWMLTEGGPGYETTTLPVLAYRVTFIDGQFGMGNTLAIIMFVFLIASAVLYFKFFDPSEEVET